MKNTTNKTIESFNFSKIYQLLEKQKYYFEKCCHHMDKYRLLSLEQAAYKSNPKLFKQWQQLLKAQRHFSSWEKKNNLHIFQKLLDFLESEEAKSLDIKQLIDAYGIERLPIDELSEQFILEFLTTAGVLNQQNSQQVSQKQTKQTLIWIFQFLNFLSVLSTITGYTPKDIIEMLQPSPQEIICEQYHVKNVENAEIRKVRLNKGTLNVRQYPNEKGKILAELPNGELICLPNKPKGNQRWLKVNIKDDNNNIITGYVNARFTEKITFINGKKL